MKPDPRFSQADKPFWAHVRTLSEKLGYTDRSTKSIRIYSFPQMIKALETLGLSTGHVQNTEGAPTEFGKHLHDYFQYRADVLNHYVEAQLMSAEEAKGVFETLKAQLDPKRLPSINKQSGEKKTVNYLTGIVNMLIEAHIGNLPCIYDPHNLTTFTRDGTPLRTMARRVDGCFPSYVNPIAVWEVKEYYYTTSFGSRVADGIYESLLDGMELEEIATEEHIHVQHVLFVDAYYTWWQTGRSYLCRLIDILNMGYVDEIIFGKEVVERLPQIVEEWVKLAHERN